MKCHRCAFALSRVRGLHAYQQYCTVEEASPQGIIKLVPPFLSLPLSLFLSLSCFAFSTLTSHSLFSFPLRYFTLCSSFPGSNRALRIAQSSYAATYVFSRVTQIGASHSPPAELRSAARPAAPTHRRLHFSFRARFMTLLPFTLVLLIRLYISSCSNPIIARAWWSG